MSDSPEKSDSPKPPPQKYDLHFHLPCGEGRPYSLDKVIYTAPDKTQLTQDSVLRPGTFVGSYPDSLANFLKPFPESGDVVVFFNIGGLVDTAPTRNQIWYCLEALLELPSTWKFEFKARYTMDGYYLSTLGSSQALTDVIVARFKQCAMDCDKEVPEIVE